MKVINIMADGKIVDDISTVTVPKDNLIYDVCAEIAKREYEESN